MNKNYRCCLKLSCDSDVHFFANEWCSSGGVVKQIVWEAGRGCMHALSDRYVSSQLTALAPHIQHRRHNLEWH